MRSIARRLRAPGDRAGSVVIMIAIALASILAFSILAVDGAILMTAKSQLQHAADSAALAGASGLMQGTQDEAVSRAIAFAGHNVAVENTQSPVVISPGDVTFPAERRVRVVTHRTVATGDPLRTYFRRVVDPSSPNTVDVTASATAEFSVLCSSDCFKPWCVPDRWRDNNGNGKYDAGIDYYDPDETGYNAPADIGLRIVLKVGNPSQTLEPGQFFAVDYPPLGQEQPPLTGGAYYRRWIATCCPYQVAVGDSLQIEPGNMVGPTIQGVEDLIAQDPNAYWDEDEQMVKGSAFGQSPRIVKVPFLDPRLDEGPGRRHVHVIKLLAFFLESVGPGSRVNAVFMQIATQGEPCENQDDPPGGFLEGIVLVQ